MSAIGNASAGENSRYVEELIARSAWRALPVKSLVTR
jgi:hypothetical protein